MPPRLFLVAKAGWASIYQRTQRAMFRFRTCSCTCCGVLQVCSPLSSSVTRMPVPCSLICTPSPASMCLACSLYMFQPAMLCRRSCSCRSVSVFIFFLRWLRLRAATAAPSLCCSKGGPSVNKNVILLLCAKVRLLLGSNPVRRLVLATVFLSCIQF